MEFDVNLGQLRIGVDNRDYHHLSQYETAPGQLDTSGQPHNIPTGIRVKSLQQEKNSKRKKIPTKKFCG